MARPRLTTALSEGLLSLPAGRIGVLRPPSDYDLSALPAADVWISHGFRPDHVFWSQGGYDLGPAPDALSACVVAVPRSKTLAKAMIAEAARLARMVIVDGQKTDGVDSLFKALRKRLGALPSVTKSHGRLFWFDSPDDLSDWEGKPSQVAGTPYTTRPGVFSEAQVDKGSAQLLAALPAKLPKRIADLGAGWGYLSAEILKAKPEIAHIDLIEAEQLAIDCAKTNVVDPRAHFHWADALTWVPDAKYDAVITNPPFHTSRASDPSLGRNFIAAAARMLVPSGRMWLVANRHLPYEASLSDHFARVEELDGDGAFKVFHAHRPKK